MRVAQGRLPRLCSAEKLVAGEPFALSEDSDEWLGHGVYFWEYGPKLAWWWAERRRVGKPAVVGAMIRLGNCFDLLDSENVTVLVTAYDGMMEMLKASGGEIPKNERHHKNLDCAVFNSFYDLIEAGGGPPIETVRGAYVPTESRKRAYKTSWIFRQTHIQLCVREPRNVLAVWHVGRDGRYGKRQEGP